MFQSLKGSIFAFWAILALALVAACAVLALAAPQFGYDVAVRDMPVIPLVAGLVTAGALFLLLPPLIRRTEKQDAGRIRPVLWLVLGAGVVMRLVLFAGEPVLEDDYQRYLWDGATVAQGLNPYAVSPEAAKRADPETSAIGQLAQDAGPVLERVNHPELRTLYPPVAEGMFALAHLIEPFSLAAWRGIIFGFDIAAVALLIVLLGDLGRSPLWAALYWWNPVILKELFNSAHMDAILAPLILAGLVLAARGRFVSATGAVVLAAGAKIWPALLLPLIWRPLLARPAQLAAAVALTLAAAILFAWPMLSAGLNETSGLVAYASEWKTNSALFPILEGIVKSMLKALGITSVSPGLAARVLVMLVLTGVALRVARSPFEGPSDLVNRALLLTGAVFLLSPAQFPWYYLWVLPLLACRPVPGLLLATITLPLYYAAFYFLPRENYSTFTGVVVWIIWLPVWIVLLFETGWLSGRRKGLMPPARRHESSGDPHETGP